MFKIGLGLPGRVFLISDLGHIPPQGAVQIDYHFLKMLLSIDHLQKEQKYPMYVTGKALLVKTAIHNEQK